MERIRRFTQFCAANDITDDTDKAGVKRRALLLTTLVEDTYRVVNDLAFPSTLDSVEFSILIQKLDSHFLSKKSSFAERYKFYKAEQRPGEDLSEWAARVRNLAQFCGFKTELEFALRDRFILGLENTKEKEKLFAESIETLTFHKALELAQSIRCARMALQVANKSGASADGGYSPTAQPMFAIHRATVRDPTDCFTKSSHNKHNKCCAVCGYRNHTKDQCRFINYKCQKCNQ
ncbi:unnamed protein product [Diatraea saccharalis]|uniref:Uncharacterized protein n=1 Tax=Diatraea saccharalis TaxID=40085 RepID=A0A9N9R2R3_9NEOP|nr:unnamed protein product [Diatraea saccharalis]